MKGVVLYGFNFKFIVVKVLCYLYGIVIFLEFDLDKYLYEKWFYDKEGIKRCKDVFDEIIVKNIKILVSGKVINKSGIFLFKD